MPPIFHTSLYMTIILDFYTQFRPPSQYLENKLEIFTCTFTSPWNPKCVSELHLITHIWRDTQVQMTLYMHSTLVPMIPPCPKHCSDLTRIYTIFGVKYGYLHVLSSPTFPLDPHICSCHSPIGKDNSIENWVPDHIIELIYKCTPIMLAISIQKLPY